VSSITAFFFAMMTNPTVQHRAQAEVDAFVVKKQRLPMLHDQAAFPYLACVAKEVLRWAPPAPLGLFHCTARPDTYKDFYIPAKTTVVANICAMMHDESVHPNPSVFDPERFARPNPQADPRDWVFGFGRHICAGYAIMHWFLSLPTVTISKAVAKDRKIIEPQVEFTTGITSHVKPFRYQITLRCPQALALIRQGL
ncbi:cytochrome P450, partial [Mycena rosella]